MGQEQDSVGGGFDPSQALAGSLDDVRLYGRVLSGSEIAAIAQDLGNTPPSAPTGVPASVDSMPTSANQEDHVSMATFAARRLHDMYENTSNILAIEWLAASQGLDFLRPLKSSDILETAKTRLRKEVPFYDKDRYFAPDIIKANTLVQQDVLSDLVDPGIRVAN